MQKIKLVFSIIMYSGFLLQTNSQDLPLISIDTSNSWEYYISSTEDWRRYHHQYYIKDSTIESARYSIFKIDIYHYLPDVYPFEICDSPALSEEVLVNVDKGRFSIRDKYGRDTLMFSTSWRVDDTISYVPGSPEDILILWKIDTITLGNKARRVWHFTNNREDDIGVFIEGIGSDIYNISDPFRHSSYSNGDLHCCYIQGNYLIDSQCLLSSTEYKRPYNYNNLRITPNPTNNGLLYISISPAEMKSLRYEVIDLSGCVVMEDEIKEQFLEVQIPNAKQGAYVVSIFRDSELITSKVIINK